MSIDKMRKEFSVWAEDEGYELSETYWDKSGLFHCYYNGSTEYAWQTWQASRRAIKQPGKMSKYRDESHGEFVRGHNSCHEEWERALGLSDD